MEGLIVDPVLGSQHPDRIIDVVLVAFSEAPSQKTAVDGDCRVDSRASENEDRCGSIRPPIEARDGRDDVPIRRLSRIRHAASSGLMFASFGVGALVLSWLVLPWKSFRLRRRSEPERFAECQSVVSRWFRHFWFGMRTLRLFDFDPRLVRAEVPNGAFVLVANHPTLVDVTAIGAVYDRMCCVAKTALFRNFMVGPLFRHVGYIEGDRTAGMPGAAVMQTALRRLEAGLPVLIFPEGTRSKDGAVGRLQRGAFELAARAGVPLVPVVLTCEPPTLSKEMSWYALPRTTARLIMEPQPPVRMDRWGGDSRAARAHFQGLFEARVAARRPQRQQQAT